MEEKINRRSTLKRIGLTTTGTIAGLSALSGSASADSNCSDIPPLTISEGETWMDIVTEKGSVSDHNFQSGKESNWYVDEFVFVRYNGSNFDDGSCTSDTVIHNFSVFSYSRSSARVWSRISDDYTWHDKMTGHGMRVTSRKENQHIEMPVTNNGGEVWEGSVLENTKEVEKSTVEREYEIDLASGAIAASETLISEVVDKSPVGWALGAKSVLGALFGGVEEKTYENRNLGDTKELTWPGKVPSASHIHDLELQQPLDDLLGGPRYRSPGSLVIESFHNDDMSANGWGVVGRDNNKTHNASVSIHIDNDAGGRGNI